MRPLLVPLTLLLVAASSGCTTLKSVKSGDQLSDADLAGKRVSFAVKPQCGEEREAEVRLIATSSIELSTGETVPAADLCYLLRHQREINPIYYLKGAGLVIVAIPMVVISAIVGAPCILRIRC